MADTAFQSLITDFADKMVIFSDPGFHTNASDPPNLKVCTRGTWNGRMVVETVFSMLTTVCQFKKLRHRTWAGFAARLAFTMAMFISSCNGTAYKPSQMALFAFRLLNLLYDDSSTIGY